MGNVWLTDMAQILRDAGLNVIEQDGWQGRSRSSGGFEPGKPLCVMWHHTASSSGASAESDTNYMSYNADAAPVANIMIARNGDVHVLAAGATNTNGSGQALAFSRGVVPEDSMNTHAIGMEIQNNGVGQEYSTECIDAAFATSNALNAAYGNLPEDVATHTSYAVGRKIDPATAQAVNSTFDPRSINSSGSWNVEDLRTECIYRAFSDGPDPGPPPTQGDDMALVVNHIVDGDGNPEAHAQFIGFGTPNSLGGWHCRVVEWFGPGESDYYKNVSMDTNIVHQPIVMAALAGMTLLGNPAEIDDSLMNQRGGWQDSHFREVCPYKH